jgi:hypothetical protein
MSLKPKHLIGEHFAFCSEKSPEKQGKKESAGFTLSGREYTGANLSHVSHEGLAMPRTGSSHWHQKTGCYKIPAYYY